VDENEDIQHTVLTVTAKDHDECECWLFLWRCSLWNGLLGPSRKSPHFLSRLSAFVSEDSWQGVRHYTTYKDEDTRV
jgi:hypothetical protein